MARPNRHRRFSDWITKHNIHIFDRNLGVISMALSLPLIYLIYRLTRDRFSYDGEFALLFITMLLMTAALSQLIGVWISKKPPGSNWRNY